MGALEIDECVTERENKIVTKIRRPWGRHTSKVQALPQHQTLGVHQENSQPSVIDGMLLSDELNSLIHG